MRKYLLVLLIFLAFVRTAGAQNNAYFPIDTAETLGFDSFVVKWYSEQLKGLGEPILFNANIKDEVYRFTWLRTFHHPVAIRIEKHNNIYILYWKMSSGAGGYGPGKLVLDKQKAITGANWKEFMMKLKEINFWGLKATEQGRGNDGSEWVLEGKTAKDYRVVSRWTPNATSGYYQCCNYLLELTGLSIKDNEKY